MRKFYASVVKHRKTIITVFLIAFVICIGCSQMVEVNYDIADYLPEGSSSTVSMEIMQEEFEGGIPNARVMIRDVSIAEALEYKEKIENVEGVSAVTWLDDSVDVKVPIQTLEEDLVETYYKDQAALYTVTMEEGKYITATDGIREVIGDENAMTGNAVSTAVCTTSTVSEIIKITIIAVAFVLFILIITLDTWAEPFLILIGLGMAIVLNNGTNLIFGEISFVTNAAGSVLQLAVSLDYSVFLLHRFVENLSEYKDRNEAMVEALCKSTSSIMSSGLTTVIGFLALVLMQFQIGPDLGLALAKGIAISLITVFLFVPSLILCAHKWIVKSRHKSFLPSFDKLGKFVGRTTIAVVCVFFLLIVPGYLASNANTYLYGSSKILGEGTQYREDTEAIEQIFGQNDTYVLMVPKGNLAKEKELSEELHEIPEVTNILSYVDLAGPEVPTSYLEESQLSLLMSENYSRMVLDVETEYEGEKTFQLVENIRNIAEKHYPDGTYLAGEGVSTNDLKETITADMTKVNFIAIAAVFMVLVCTLKSLILPIVLVMSIESAIWFNLSFPYFLGSPIYYLAYLIISSVQLGATVDYAILMTERYYENRENLEKKHALVQTISDVFVSVMTSGTTLTVVGMLLGIFSSNQLLAQLGIFIGRGGALSLAIVLFVLPGLLYLTDRKDSSKKLIGRKIVHEK